VCSLVCLCVFLFAGVILWMCVAVHVFPRSLGLGLLHTQRNADGASGVMCRVVSLVAAYNHNHPYDIDFTD
jgi:hypothetical protein